MKSTENHENPMKSSPVFHEKKRLPPARLHPRGLSAGSSRSVNKKWPRKSTSKFISLGPQNHLKQLCFIIQEPAVLFISLHLCYFFKLIRAVCSFTRIYLYIYLLYIIYVNIFLSLWIVDLHCSYEKRTWELTCFAGTMFLGNGFASTVLST